MSVYRLPFLDASVRRRWRWRRFKRLLWEFFEELGRFLAPR